MTEWYLINPQPTLNSGFEKDEFTDYAQDGFDELLTETQLGKAIKFCKGKFDGENFEVEVDGEADDVADSVGRTRGGAAHGWADGLFQEMVHGEEQKEVHTVVDGGRYAAVDDETGKLCLAGIAVLQS